MALDTVLVAKQQKKLTEYIALSRQIESNLKIYRDRLNTAWSAREITYFNQAIDDLRKQNRQLTVQIEVLQEMIVKATDEILEEEAAEAALIGGVQ